MIYKNQNGLESCRVFVKIKAI